MDQQYSDALGTPKELAGKEFYTEAELRALPSRNASDSLKLRMRVSRLLTIQA